MAFVDSHCHLFYTSYDHDLVNVLTRAKESGVERIIVPGIDLETSSQSIKLSETYPDIWAAVGIHPNDANEWNDEIKDKLRSQLFHSRVVAVGEIGLDYYHKDVDRERQLEVFLDQLKIASDIKKPVIIHSRDAICDVYDVVFQWLSMVRQDGYNINPPGIIHAFEGDASYANKLIDLGFLIGVGGPVTYKNPSRLYNIIRNVNMSSVVLETDSPFLPPHPHRGERNEPSYIKYIANAVSSISGMDIDQVADTTTKNLNFLFMG